MWAIFSLAIETALRRGEMAKLEWSHLPWQRLPDAARKHQQEQKTAHGAADAPGAAHHHVLAENSPVHFCDQ